MLCKRCKNKPMAKWIKIIKCFRCDKDTIINADYTDICIDCSNQLNVCQCCGEQIKEEKMFSKISQYDLITARNTYDQLIKMNKSLLYSNPLLDKEDVNEKTGYITDAVIYQIQRLLGIKAGEDESFDIVLDSIDAENCFDDMLFELQRALGIEVEE